MTGAGTPMSDFAGTLNTTIYYAITPKSAIPFKLLSRPPPLGYSLIQAGDTLYYGIGLAYPL